MLRISLFGTLFHFANATYRSRITSLCLGGVLLAGLAACQPNNDESLLPQVDESERVRVTDERITNLEAPIPSQCYTRTESQHNPCYTCHQRYPSSDTRTNKLDDGALQGGYAFSDEGLTNHWQNLFVDRQEWLNQISDAAILEYINQDNYAALAENLNSKGWKGYSPDLADFAFPEKAFDEQGFARDNSGWVAFNYKPFLGTFWPTNGSTDDVIIRLPSAFRERNGEANRDIYLINLSLLEMNIKQLDALSIPPMDEPLLDLDLNGDGQLTAHVTHLNRRDHYVGDAAEIALNNQQYPADTEFLHSVRYVGVDSQGDIYTPPRMKELRYMRKIRELQAYDVDSRYARERKEKRLGMLPDFVNHYDRGLENGMGWMLRGFIEDYNGQLRPQSYEESMACMGCHAAIGTTIDHTFAFGRKVSGADGWGYIDTRGMADAPSIAEDDGEILNYLRRAGGGSEFRENPEMLARWYHENGEVNEEKVRKADVYSLISPSPERALKLNKAYTHLVRHQSYIYGRDATWLPARNVFHEVNPGEPPLDSAFQYFGWDLRLNWHAQHNTEARK